MPVALPPERGLNDVGVSQSVRVAEGVVSLIEEIKSENMVRIGLENGQEVIRMVEVQKILRLKIGDTLIVDKIEH